MIYDNQYLDFEKDILKIDTEINKIMEASTNSDNKEFETTELNSLRKKSDHALKNLYSNLTPWQKVCVARHANRPHFSDYLNKLIHDFVPLSGDKLFGEDEALIAGIGFYHGRTVAILGQEKGDDLESRMKHSFGMAKPEGYRKAKRLMEFANNFGFPIISFIDTAGAYPGIEGEERGQAEAIASCISKSFDLSVPFISVIIGEGGSGGAIAVATANRILMLEHSIYSVISPEGCASILWRDAKEVKKAAEALHLTAQELLKYKIIDEIIPEPLGGAHRDKIKTIDLVDNSIFKHLTELSSFSPEKLKKDRECKFLNFSSKQ